MEAYCYHDKRIANPFYGDLDKGIGGIESAILAPISISVKNVFGNTCAEDFELIKSPNISGFFTVTFPSIEKINFKGSDFKEYLYSENLAQYEEDSSAYKTYESLCGDFGNIELTDEGTKAFFEILKQPNPARDRLIEESKGISTSEQRAKFGKERVYVNLELEE